MTIFPGLSRTWKPIHSINASCIQIIKQIYQRRPWSRSRPIGLSIITWFVCIIIVAIRLSVPLLVCSLYCYMYSVFICLISFFSPSLIRTLEMWQIESVNPWTSNLNQMYFGNVCTQECTHPGKSSSWVTRPVQGRRKLMTSPLDVCFWGLAL